MTAVTVRSELQFDRWSLIVPFRPHLYPPSSQPRASRVARLYPATLTACCEPPQPEISGQKHTHTHTQTHTTHRRTHTHHTHTHTPHTHKHTHTHTTHTPHTDAHTHTHHTHTHHTHTPHTHTHTHHTHTKRFPLKLPIILADISAGQSQTQLYSGVSVFALSTGSD